MKNLRLFIVLLGGRQKDDKIEAHNLFTGVGETLKSLLVLIKKSWDGVTHLDAAMEVEQVDGYKVVIRNLNPGEIIQKETYPKLMIFNIGYYKKGQFAEFHKLIPMVIKTKEDKWRERLKNDPDFAEGQAFDEISRSHVDDTFSVTGTVYDVDDVIDVQQEVSGYVIELIPLEETAGRKENLLELGYNFVKELKEIK